MPKAGRSTATGRKSVTGDEVLEEALGVSFAHDFLDGERQDLGLAERRAGLVTGDSGFGAGRQLHLDGSDLGFHTLGVAGTVLGLGAMLLLDEFDKLELEPDHMVFEAGVGHAVSVPVHIDR